MIAALLLSVAGLSPPLAECRRLEEAFDTAAMPAPCKAALNDVGATVAERAEAARLLAFALVTNGDAEGAEAAFLRLLVLAPSSTLQESASPRLKDVFARAQARLAGEGKVGLTVGAVRDGASWALTSDIVDALGRAARVQWTLAPGPDGAAASTPEVRGALASADAAASTSTATSTTASAATKRFTAKLPVTDAATCAVEVLAADGTAIVTAPCEGYAPTTTESETDATPWIIAGSVGGAAVVVGVAVGVLVWALNAGPLAPPATVTVSVQ
jgi:hypothetical protein